MQLNSALHEARLRGFADFKASNGWFQNYRKRYQICKILSLHGEAADVNIQETEPLIEVIELIHVHIVNRPVTFKLFYRSFDKN